MLETLNGIYNAIKLLDIKPTPENVAIINAIYNSLGDVHKQVKELLDSQESNAEEQNDE